MSKARRGKARANRQGQTPALPPEAARYLELGRNELSALVEKARIAVEAVSDLDNDRRSDADVVAKLASEALGRDCVLEDMVDRQMIRSELIHVQRMCEVSLRIQEIRRKKEFTQSAVQLLFDGRKTAQPAADWQSLFGAK